MAEVKKVRKVRSRPTLPKGLQNLLVLQIFLIIKAFVWLAAHLSENQARFLDRIVYLPSSGFIRRVCRRNLAAFFPSLSRDPAKLKQLHRAYLEYMVRFLDESGRCFFVTAPELEAKVWLRGEEHLQETLKKGRGALVVSGHMGTWWHVPCLLARRGYKVNVVFNSFPFPAIENYLIKQATRYGVKLTFVDRGIPRMMRRAAENNEVVYLTFDVSVRRHHGNWLPFGATKININPGPALLALRCRMPTLYASTFHGDPRRSHLIIHPAVHADSEAGELRPSDLCRAWVEQLHSEILLHPEQWWGWGFSDLPYVRRQSSKASDTATVSEPVASNRRSEPYPESHSVCVT